MSASPAGLIAYLRRRYAPKTADGDLVRAYAAGRDESAFRQIVARHGPTILRLCRRRLGDLHAAEDAFQATFLTLARGAGSIRKPDALAAWLYGVAYRITGKARARHARQRQLETHAASPPSPDPADELSARELLDALDDELHRLPERYRLPLWLCYWQGLTQEDAARRLGCTPGAVKGRLERGRAKLADRLTRRGLAPSALLVAPLATATVSRDLLAATAALAADPWSKALPVAVLALATAATSAKLVPIVALGVLLAGAGLAALAGVGPWRAGSVNDQSEAQPPVAHAPGPPVDEQPATPRLDAFGDPLPAGAVQRLGTLRYHTGWPILPHNRIYLPDGKTLLTYSNGDIRWFEAEKGLETDSWNPPAGLSVAGVSPDGRIALLTESTFQPKTIRVWDLIARKELRAFEVPDQGRLVVNFSPDSRQVAVADHGRLRLWDVMAGKMLWQRDGVVHPDRPEGVIGFSPDGRTLVTQKTTRSGIQPDSEIFTLDRLTGKVVRSYSMPGSLGAALSPDGASLIVRNPAPPASMDVCNLENGQRLFRLGGEMRNINQVAFSIDGTRLVTEGPFVAGKATAAIWEWPSGKLLRQIEFDVNQLDGLRFTPDGKRLEVSVAGASVTRYWDVESGQPVATPEGHTRPVLAVRFTQDRNIVTIGEDKTAQVWNPATGRRVRQVDISERQGGAAKFVSADGRTVVMSATARNPVQIWDLATGRLSHSVPLQESSAQEVALTSDGRLLATNWDGPAGTRGPPARFGGGSQGVRLWEVASGREVRQISHPRCKFFAFSPDGQFLVTASLDGVHIWDMATGRRIRSWDGDFLCFAFAPDGRSLACVSAKEVVGHELASGGIRWRFPTPETKPSGSYGISVAFAPDGRRFALQDDSHGVRVWNVESGQNPQTFAGHQRAITSVVFAPDGRTLATASLDTTAMLWATPILPELAAALSADEASTAWTDLAHSDAAVAFRVIKRLRDDPARSLPLLRERLLRARPRAPAVDAGRVAQLVAQLDDGRFEMRERATRDLAALGVGAAPALRQLLTGQPTPEARRRAEEVLAKLDDPAPDAEALSDLRAVEVLEAVATPEARALLEELAKGDPAARLTREAKASLDRLKQRTGG